MPIQIELWGPYACFTRPEMKTERVSYDVMTPSAARGILEAIYWHPGMDYKIDRIHVCAPIKTMNIRRNEIKAVASAANAKKVIDGGQADLYLVASKEILQRASIVLKDVHYVVEAHFDMTPEATAEDNPGKFADIITRRIERGQCYHQPCFGTREFPANFCMCGAIPPCPDELRGERDLGYMLWGMDYTDPKNILPMFFRASLKDGVLQIPSLDSGEVIR